MIYLRRADIKGLGHKGPMCGYVVVPAHTASAWKGGALFRPNDAHDTLSLVGHANVLEAKVARSLLQFQDLGPRVYFQDEGFHGAQLGPVLDGHVVVHCDQGAVRAPDHIWFASMRPLRVWGNVTSWTRLRSMYRKVDQYASQT